MRLESELRSLLSRSGKRLHPFSDPLLANAGLNRWLRAEREEAYSDWLAWVLQQLKADDILSLLHLDSPDMRLLCKGLQPNIERELIIPEGRLDIVVQFGTTVLIVIEVKTTSADSAFIDKHEGYSKWLARQAAPCKPTPLLLAVDAEEQEYKGFVPLLWSDLCIGLRQLIPAIWQQLGVTKAAMLIAFVSAVETNLLHLVAPGKISWGRTLFYGRTIDHIERAMTKDVKDE
jgi:hypothetical protein